MNQTELKAIIEKHKLWLYDQPVGKRADLTWANLTGADFTGANLTGANLTRANLTGANFTGANLDFASWPLWCGSLKAYVDDRIVIQLLYHTLSVVHYSPYVSQEVKEALLADGNVDIANRFHRVEECERLSAYADI